MKIKNLFLYFAFSVSNIPIYFYSFLHTIASFTSNDLAAAIPYFKLLCVLLLPSFSSLLNQFCH